MWSLAYTGFLSSGALRGVGGGNQTEGDSWVLWRSHRSLCSQANAQGDEETDPNPEARAARATPPVQARAVLPRVCGAANPSVSPARQLRAGSLVHLCGSREVSPITNRGLGRRAGGG